MVVIGNKVDMKKDRAVSKEEGKALADDFGAGFLEVSVQFLISYEKQLISRFKKNCHVHVL